MRETDVEELSPTRVRLTIEIQFDELKPSLEHAYREVAQAVPDPRVPARARSRRGSSTSGSAAPRCWSTW